MRLNESHRPVDQIQVFHDPQRSAYRCIISYTHRGVKYRLRDAEDDSIVLVDENELVYAGSSAVVQQKFDRIIASLKKFGLLDP